MASLEDQEYFADRAKQEQTMADQATGTGISSLHRQMAVQYLKLAASPKPKPEKRLFMLRHEPLDD